MNILFIGGQGSTSDANGVCIRNMAREMISRGHKVWILAMGDKFDKDPGIQDGATLTELPMDHFKRLTLRTEKSNNRWFHLYFCVIALFRHIILLPFYPNTSPIRAIKLFRKARVIVDTNKINLVVTTFCPYDNIYAGINLKKIYGSRVRVISYHLDLRTGSQNPSKLVRNYIYKHALASLSLENKIVDKLLIPYSGKLAIENNKNLDMAKIKYVGLPVFTIDSLYNKCKLPYKKDDINICYIGTLYYGNRDPRYFMSLIEQAASILNLNILVHFWGDIGTFGDDLKSSNVAICHGMIDNSYVRYLMDNSDFLLNIGNAIVYDLLPSKIFGMFATGKPIINMVTHPQDVTIPFFARYNNSVDIHEYEKDANDLNKILNFIKTKKGSLPICVDALFDDFKPSTICDYILNA